MYWCPTKSAQKQLISEQTAATAEIRRDAQTQNSTTSCPASDDLQTGLCVCGGTAR